MVLTQKKANLCADDSFIYRIWSSAFFFLLVGARVQLFVRKCVWMSVCLSKKQKVSNYYKFLFYFAVSKLLVIFFSLILLLLLLLFKAKTKKIPVVFCVAVSECAIWTSEWVYKKLKAYKFSILILSLLLLAPFIIIILIILIFTYLLLFFSSHYLFFGLFY